MLTSSTNNIKFKKKAFFGNTYFDILPETKSVKKITSNKNILSSRIRTLLTFKKLINCLIKNGKRGTVERILFKCCVLIKIGGRISSRKFIYQAIHNVKPLIELRNLRKQNKGSRRQKTKVVPILTCRAEKLAIQWIIEGAKSREVKTMSLGLYLSLLDSYQKKGYAMKKKDDLHRACKLNILSQTGIVKN